MYLFEEMTKQASRKETKIFCLLMHSPKWLLELGESKAQSCCWVSSVSAWPQVHQLSPTAFPGAQAGSSAESGAAGTPARAHVEYWCCRL